MRILVVYNPHSGKGRGPALAGSLAGELESEGHDARLVSIARGRSDVVLAEPADDADLMLVVGGDGTVRWSARAASEHDLPVYHVPMGTENLFSREHGMTASIEDILLSIERWDVRPMDAAECMGRLFLLMCSIGADASVIHRLDERRSGSISHLSYVVPSLLECVRPHVGPVSVSVDGREVVREGRGILVIANSREYALGMNPARRADVSDGLLDVAYFPGTLAATLLGWAARCLVGDPLGAPSAIHERGARIVVERSSGRCPVQFDGEAFHAEANGSPELIGRYDTASIEIAVRPAALKVLKGVGGG